MLGRSKVVPLSNDFMTLLYHYAREIKGGTTLKALIVLMSGFTHYELSIKIARYQNNEGQQALALLNSPLAR